jgi:hypothetical protein
MSRLSRLSCPKPTSASRVLGPKADGLGTPRCDPWEPSPAGAHGNGSFWRHGLHRGTLSNQITSSCPSGYLISDQRNGLGCCSTRTASVAVSRFCLGLICCLPVLPVMSPSVLGGPRVHMRRKCIQFSRQAAGRKGIHRSPRSSALRRYKVCQTHAHTILGQALYRKRMMLASGDLERQPHHAVSSWSTRPCTPGLRHGCPPHTCPQYHDVASGLESSRSGSIKQDWRRWQCCDDGAT